MGIYDRDYYREQSAQGGGFRRARLPSFRMWSANTWIIVICVAVFVIDGFLRVNFSIPVLMQRAYAEQIDPRDVDKSALIEGPLQVTESAQGIPLAATRDLFLQGQQGPVAVGRDRLQYMPPLEAALHFSTQRGFLRVEFWRFVGFQFLHSHGTLTHIVFNMIGLFFFGPMVEQYLGSKRYVAFYLLCGIFGALMYTLLNLGGFAAAVLGISVPGLLFSDISTPLIGASAGVFGVLLAGAYRAPDTKVLLFFVVPMRLATLAYALVAIALLTILFGGQNAGGEAGHLGGAIAGFYFIRHPHHLHGFFDILGRIDPTSHHYRRGRGGATSRVRAIAPPPASRREKKSAPSRTEIDAVLDKVHNHGLASLTDREKRILREASER